MKHIGIIILLAITITSCTDTKDNSKDNNLNTDVIKNANTADSIKATQNTGIPKITFEEEEHDFGTIKAGEVVSYAFTFTNTGDADLIIATTKASCGCTVAEFPKQPLKPGEKGNIEVSFDSSGRSGKQSKTVTVKANTEPVLTKIKITAEIEKE